MAENNQDNPINFDTMDTVSQLAELKKRREKLDELRAAQTPQEPKPVDEQLDPNLLRALEERDRGMEEANKLRMMKRLMDVGSQYAGSDYKADMGSVETLERKAKAPLERYQLLKQQESAKTKEKRASEMHEMKMTEFQQKLDKASLDFLDKKKTRSPSSLESVTAQERVIEIETKMGKTPDQNRLNQIRSSSAADLVKVHKYLEEDLKQYMTNQQKKADRESREKLTREGIESREKIAADSLTAQEKRWEAQDERAAKKEEKAQKRLELSEKKTEEQRTRFHRTKALDELQKISTNKSYQEADKAIDAVNNVRNLAKDAKEKGGQSLAMLGPRIAKGIAGEVGVLTELDVTRYVQNPQIVQSMKDTIAKVLEGKLTEPSYENLMRLADIMEQDAKHRKSEIIKKRATSYSRIMKIPFAEAMSYFDPDSAEYKPGEEKTKEIRRKTKDGKIAIFDENKKFLRYEGE